MEIVPNPKIFCIGWHKTGTSTLGSALIELGYSVVGARLDLEAALRTGNTRIATELAGEFDACQDFPWAVLFRELDAAYPGAHFIFTDREDENWLHSAVNHFKDVDISMHDWIYGRGKCLGNESLYLERFRRHRSEVRKWFAGRPNDILEMNLEKGAGWEELCAFLGKPVPAKPWPHSNKGKHSLNRREQIVDAIKRSIPTRVRKWFFSLRLNLRKKMGLPDPRNMFNNFEQNRQARRKSQNDR